MRLSNTLSYVGIALCVAAMLMPAVQFPPDNTDWGAGLASYPERGYECALATLWAASMGIVNPSLKSIQLLLIGCVNPLVLLYFLLSTVNRVPRILPFLAAAILAGCVATWMELARWNVTLLSGHYCWIAGIALILCAPLADRLNPQTNG